MSENENMEYGGEKTESDIPDVMVHPPTLLILTILIGFTFNRFYPAPFVGDIMRWGGGFAFLSMGMFISLWALYTMYMANTNIPTMMPVKKLVMHGPFYYMRNPIYVGALLQYLAVAHFMNNAWLLLCMVVVAIILHYGVVLREEKLLHRKFGDTYGDYCARTARWFIF